MGYYADHRDAGQLLELPRPWSDVVQVPADVVEDDPLDTFPVLLGEQLHRSDGVGEGTAPFDVDHKDHIRIGYLRRTHVGDVLVVDVNLRGGSGTFHDDEIVPLLQEIHMFSDDLPAGSGYELVVVSLHIVVCIGLPADDDLGGSVLLGFQQDRVHVMVRVLESRCLGLQRLDHGDLGAVPRDLRVEAHVL